MGWFGRCFRGLRLVEAQGILGATMAFGGFLVGVEDRFVFGWEGIDAVPGVGGGVRLVAGGPLQEWAGGPGEGALRSLVPVAGFPLGGRALVDAFVSGRERVVLVVAVFRDGTLQARVAVHVI